MERLNRNECRTLLTDEKVLECLDDFDKRFYKLYVNGMPMSGLAKLTLEDEGLAKKLLQQIERKIWHAAPKVDPPDIEESQSEPRPRLKSLRLRAGLTARETAGFLKDDRVRDVAGEAEATFYEQFASGNYPMAKLIAYVGSSNAVGVRVYAERIENFIIREALHHRLLKTVEPPPEDRDAQYERELDEDARLAGKQRLTGFSIKKKKG